MMVVFRLDIRLQVSLCDVSHHHHSVRKCHPGEKKKDDMSYREDATASSRIYSRSAV